MTEVLAEVSATAALLISAAAVVSGLVVLLRTRRPALALGVFLDLLTAAGLLRLAGEPSWQTLASAAAVVAIRHLVGAGLRIGGRSWLARTGPPRATG